MDTLQMSLFDDDSAKDIEETRNVIETKRDTHVNPHLNGWRLNNEETAKTMLMRLHLQATVPFAIHDLVKMGGITDWHLKRVSGYAWDIGSGGDALLYRVKGESAKMMGKLVEALSVMAFLPGGVDFLGLHFEVPIPAKQAIP